MKKQLKLMSLLLSLTLLLISAAPLAANASDATATQSDSRIDAILALSGLEGIPANTFHIVSLQGGSSNTLSTATQGKLAIQSTVINNDQVEVTTVIPYKVTASGELVNSFEYAAASNQTRNIFNPTVNFLDTSVVIKVYYAYYRNTIDLMSFYRHAGVEAYWSSNNDTVTVDTLIVNYESAGELFAYPECMAQNALDHRLAYDYLIGSYINEENPPENELYVSMQAPMPQNRVLYLSDGMYHGGVVSVRLEYSVNGNDRNDFDSFEIYSP